MKNNVLGFIVHTLNLRKLSKPAVLCIAVLFIVSMVSVLGASGVQAASTPALHTSENKILDSNGNAVNLRGVGLNGPAPATIFWGPGYNDNTGDQWIPGTTSMDQTFQALQQVYHVNMVRVFIYPSWIWRDNISPAQETGYSGYGSSSISTVGYLQTMCTEAAKYGIYVDMCPFQVTPDSSSYGGDPYCTPNKGGSQGLPLLGFDSQATAFFSAVGYVNNEQGFWTAFWTKMGNDFKAYPNAIFEAWNEADTGNSPNTIPTEYITYLSLMFNAIRGTSATNLIFMQWQFGWFPNGWGMNLSWASQINTALSNPTNIVYTTHFYYYAPTDLTALWASVGIDYNGIYKALQGAWQSLGVNAPLVANEAGDCSYYAANMQNDNTWWNNICQATASLGIGLGAYYWASPITSGGLGWLDEALISGPWQMGQSSPPPNTFGQEFINSNLNSSTTTTSSSTPAPSATPTPSPSSTPQATTIPSPTPISTSPAPQPTNNPAAVSSSNSAPSPLATASPSNDPTPTSSSTSAPLAPSTSNPVPSSKSIATTTSPTPQITLQPTSSPSLTQTTQATNHIQRQSWVTEVFSVFMRVTTLLLGSFLRFA